MSHKHLCLFGTSKKPQPEMTKTGLGFAYRTKPTKTVVEMVLPKLNSSRVGLSNKKSLWKKSL
jgi:hypothetical protein